MQMLERLKKRIARPIQGGLYFSCLSRGHNLFGEAGIELEILRDAIGDVPLAGFFANGEISHQPPLWPYRRAGAVSGAAVSGFEPSLLIFPSSSRPSAVSARIHRSAERADVAGHRLCDG